MWLWSRSSIMLLIEIARNKYLGMIPHKGTSGNHHLGICQKLTTNGFSYNSSAYKDKFSKQRASTEWGLSYAGATFPAAQAASVHLAQMHGVCLSPNRLTAILQKGKMGPKMDIPESLMLLDILFFWKILSSILFMGFKICLLENAFLAFRILNYITSSFHASRLPSTPAARSYKAIREGNTELFSKASKKIKAFEKVYLMFPLSPFYMWHLSPRKHPINFWCMR